MPFDSVGGDHYLGERPSESTSLTRSTDRRYGTATFVEPNFARRQAKKCQVDKQHFRPARNGVKEYMQSRLPLFIPCCCYSSHIVSSFTTALVTGSTDKPWHWHQRRSHCIPGRSLLVVIVQEDLRDLSVFDCSRIVRSTYRDELS